MHLARCISTGLVHRFIGLFALGLVGTGIAAPMASAETCTRDSFRKIVDETGQALRRQHAEAQPRLAQAFRRLKDINGWSEEEHIDRAMMLVTDLRSERLDTRSAELLALLDKFAEGTGSEPLDCSKLADLEAASIELQATVKAKTEYALSKLDQLARDKDAAQRPAIAAQPPVAQPQPAPTPPPAPAPPQAKTQPPAAPPIIAAPAQPKPPASPWTTTTREAPPSPTPPQAAPQAPQTAPPSPLPQAAMPPPSQDGFSKEEIQEASRGFFGTISTGLANVIEHAFAKAGRPSGYVLGSEGGGAFIAGVRYGNGTLFTRSGRSREVYWHGPSIGYDFGASGAKTMFLVYNLRDELDIFAGFSGVEGSAYLVGGVGMTFLTDGRVVLAPIRSGIGLRLGANVGYLRFTARPTWNPF